MKTSVLPLAIASALWIGTPVQAAIKNVRVVWDNNPATEAVIGFSRSGSSSSGQYVVYGATTTESSWTRNSTVVSRTFKTSLVNYFVRLEGLSPNTEYFFKACDSSGCSPAYMFRTAASGQQAMTFITGGDSRTNRTQRQQGNRLVQKIRPAFVMFSGDYTDNHSATEVDTWLTDWLLTYADSTVNGVAFKQITPLIPTVGNHESSDMLFMCSVFGVDADRNGSCSMRDTYFALNVGTTARIYTLNTEFGTSNANDRTAQLSWLNTDLAANAASATWRLAQYHKPMLPRSSAKNAVNAIAMDWAQPFLDHRMNLVSESDTHMAKYTYPVVPNGSSDYKVADLGTVYIGEGAWGAPLRTADRPASWLVDLSSFMHINIVQINGSDLTVRSAYLSGESATTALTKAARDADPLALPTGMQLWNAATVGNSYQLTLDASTRLTRLKNGVPAGTGKTTTLSAVRDVTVGSGGYYSNGNTVLADGSDGGQVLRAMFGWDLSSVPAATVLTGASIQLNVTNVSKGTYNLNALTGAWAETGATYAQSQATGSLIGTVVPSATGAVTIKLNAAGLALVQGWLNGTVSNHGIVLNGTTTDGVDVSSREAANAARLILQY